MSNEPLLEDNDGEENGICLLTAARRHGDIFYWLARPACCPCDPEENLKKAVKQFGENKELDTQYRDTEYHVFRLALSPIVPGEEEKVEIEHTSSTESKEKALHRLEDIYKPLIPSGILLWIWVVGGGLLGGLVSDCSAGMNPIFFGFAVTGALYQLYKLNWLTLLLSQTTVEGRCLARLTDQLSCLDNYRFTCVMAVVDMFGRFTRANFVGYTCKCGSGIDTTLVKSFKMSSMWIFAPFVEHLGIMGLSLISFIIGPLIIQTGYMLWCRHVVLAGLEDVKRDMAEERSMMFCSRLGHLGAMAHWAMLNPINKIFECARVPLTLDDLTDAYRMWDRMRTQVLVTVANILSDSILQMSLQARFLAFAFPSIDNSLRFQVALNIVLAAVDAIGSSKDMVSMNRTLSVAAGVSCLSLSITPLLRLVAAWTCSSHVLNVFPFPHCDDDLTASDYGNFTGMASGILPEV